MMTLAIETFRQVWETFRSNRMRFALTLLGVVIGSASLVLLSGLLEGGKEALILASHRASEDDLVTVSARRAPEKDRHRTTRPLEQPDASALDDSPLMGDARVISQRQMFDTVFWRDRKKDVRLVGARPDATSIYRLEVARGRFITDQDLIDRRRVAVVGHKIWQDLLDEAAALDGLEVKTGGERFQVVGVLAHKPSFGKGGPWEWDGRVLLPYTTYDVLFPPRASGRAVDQVFVRLSGVQHLAERIDGVRKLVKATLLRRHYNVENFRIMGEDGEDAKGELIIQIISMLVLATAVMSLVVGGINVMNIMLVSVTERTREIGVRRAVGAPRRTILLQFLAESTVTAGLGGVVGVLGGVSLTALASVVLRRTMDGWTFHVVSWAPPAALGAALLVGVVFGLYPAWRASRLHPVEALRFE